MSRSRFAIGVAVALLLMVAAGLGIRSANAGTHRPEGVAERWLSAIGDTTRKGVKNDARRRAGDLGEVSLGDRLVPTTTLHGKSAFTDLEVGKGRPAPDAVEVPFQLHQRTAGGDAGSRLGGVIVLTEAATGARWRVVGVVIEPGRAAVPSNGAPAPSKAGWSLWIGGAVAGLAVAVLCSLLVVWAGRAERAGPPSSLTEPSAVR